MERQSTIALAKSLIFISGIPAKWGMNAILPAFFGPRWGRQCIFCPKMEANREFPYSPEA
jgi:hypothetical protein